MTFTQEEIQNAKLTIDYNDEWQFNDKEKTVDVKFYGFEDMLRRFFNLEDDYGDDWIDCYATIDPVNGVVTEIYMQFTSNCEIPDRELQLKITNKPEGELLLNNMMANDLMNGGFISFLFNAKAIYKRKEN